MITVLECALLSGHVYEPDATTYMGLNLEITNLDKIDDNLKTKVYVWYRMKDVDSIMHVANPYFAALYIKFDLTTKRATDAVIAIRGTDTRMIDNLVVDGLSWFSDVLGDGAKAVSPEYYLTQVVRFTHKARDYLKRFFQHVQITFTGHSLGGALAQLLILRGYFAGPVVAFNAPGVGHFKQVNLFNYCFISNINARYCAISRVGKIIGKVDVVDVIENQEIAKALFDNLNREEYEFSQLLYQLNDRLDAANPMNLNPVLGLLVKIMTNTTGVRYRTSAYYHSYSTHSKSAAIKALVAERCASTNIVFCEAKVSAEQAGNALLAQHSIKNVIKALGQRQYAKIAYRSPAHPHGPNRCFGQIGAS